jgi:hypothetical protein
MEKSEKQENANSENPILIFDQNSGLGKIIALHFSKEFLCVLASSILPERTNNIIPVSLTKQVPAIPKCKYKAFFLIYNSDRTLLDLLPAIAQKAKEDNAHIYFLLTVHEASAKLLDRILDVYSAITILLVGDIFDTKLSWNNPVEELWKQAKTGKIILKNNGLSLVYPVGIEDALSVLARLVHLKGISGHRTLYLLPPHPVTQLSFTRALHKKEPLLKIDFIETYEDNAVEYAPKAYASALGPTYAYTKKLPTVQIIPVKKKIKIAYKQKRRLQMPLRKSIYLFIIFLAFIFFGLPIASAFAGVGYLYRTQTHAMRGDWEKARVSAKAAEQFFAFAERSSGAIKSLDIVGLGRQEENIISGMQAGRIAANALSLGIDGVTSLDRVFFKNSINPKQDFLTGIQNIKDALVQISVLQAEGKIPQQYGKELGQLTRFSHLITLADVLPHLVGMDGKRKYLVLFQNNMELRPGGGFIGSYGILNLDKGKVTDFPIQDVYDADGQLKEHIEPPFQLRRYLGGSHWFLRDSNFDIDFTKNGASAAFFYNAETKGEVDGVIAVDASFMRMLLGLVGPLKVVGYNETVTADNFFVLTERYAQDNFFPGSLQKQNFLKAVAVSLFARLQLLSQSPTQSKDTSYLTLVSAVSDGISQKHILFAFPDDSIQKIFSLNGMSSSLLDTREEKDGQINDFFGINEANLGQNKVNYYLDRSIAHTVKLSADGSVSETATILYGNRSTQLDKYGGDYKSYVRFILPSGAKLTSVTINGQEQTISPAVIDPAVFTAKGFNPQEGLEVERTEAYGKTIYGFLVVVPLGEKKTVAVAYTVPAKTTIMNSTISYSLRVFKQPGTEADPYSLTFAYPAGYSVLSASDALKINNSNVSLLTTLIEDKEIALTMVKK